VELTSAEFYNTLGNGEQKAEVEVIPKKPRQKTLIM